MSTIATEQQPYVQACVMLRNVAWYAQIDHSHVINDYAVFHVKRAIR
jgi:hypothetical protein